MTDQLTDSGYIEWAKQQEWSLTQAIYLLHGEDPPGSEQNEQVKTLEGQIECLTAKNIFQRHEEVQQRIEHLETLSRQSPEDEMLKRDLAQLKADYLSPASWIHYAATIGIDVNNCWEALFHEYLAPELDYALFEKQEYSRFIRIFVTDEWTPLEYLVLYVKELPMDQLTYTSGDARTVKEEFDELLLKMNTALELNKKLVDLPDCTVSPRAFIQEYCRLHPNHEDRFTKWGGWLSDHKKLAKALKQSSKTTKQERHDDLDVQIIHYIRAEGDLGYAGWLRFMQNQEVNVNFNERGWVSWDRAETFDPQKPHKYTEQAVRDRLTKWKPKLINKTL
jgi:hypothetical protein